MLSHADNETLTRVGPDTLVGRGTTVDREPGVG